MRSRKLPVAILGAASGASVRKVAMVVAPRTERCMKTSAFVMP